MHRDAPQEPEPPARGPLPIAHDLVATPPPPRSGGGKPEAPNPDRRLPFTPAEKGREASVKSRRTGEAGWGGAGGEGLPPGRQEGRGVPVPPAEGAKPSRGGAKARDGRSADTVGGRILSRFSGRLPLSILVPTNIVLLLALAAVPSFLLYRRTVELEEDLSRKEEGLASRTADWEDTVAQRIDQLHARLDRKGSLSEDAQAEEVAMVRQASRAVIHIEQTTYKTDGGNRYTVKRAGSGFLFDSEGYALTNFHVIDGYDELKAYLHGGQEVHVKLVGKDPPSDVALLRLLDLDRVAGPEDLAPLPLGESASLASGEVVYALGSPRNLQGSAARGIVSNPTRHQPSLMLETSGINTGLFNNWIQTDAPINRGNSGGPLVDLSGRVVGIVTRKMLEAEAIGFAIPIDHVQAILPLLKRDELVRRSTIGVLLAPYRPDRSFLESGVQVQAVLRGGPADAAGIRPGDILNRIGEVTLAAPLDRDLPEAWSRISACERGVPVRVAISRDQTPMAVTVTPRLREEIDDKFFHFPLLGCSVAPIEPSLRRLFHVAESQGLWIAAVEANGRFAHEGFRAGDVIVKIGGEPVSRLGQLKKQIDRVENQSLAKIELEFSREGTAMSKSLTFHFLQDE
ncbi:MAG: trypsin-like peptidase domain-containing protein [Planctomycetes bacterium]|nr:trypsin-like peptidase domain-containing protein [Planctomycetota bacterium]